jgi:mannose-6-phosphate isomerase-like protein (cupin superfamily)
MIFCECVLHFERSKCIVINYYMVRTNPQPVRFLPANYTRLSLEKNPDSFPKGKSPIEPLASISAKMGIPLVLLAEKDVEKGENLVEVHRHEADLWICLEGTITFSVGGSMVNPYTMKTTDGSENDFELRATHALNAEIFVLNTNDVLYIPEGQPHTHWTGNNFARLWIIKIPAIQPFPLFDVAGWSPV